MRAKSPSSREHVTVRFSAFDIFWAAISPLIALYLRDVYVLSPSGAQTALLYCGLSLICSLIAFQAFRLSDSISDYFSAHDALNVVKAVVAAGLMSSLLLFTLNRLDGIPRATPLLQLLILGAGLLTVRSCARLLHDEGHVIRPRKASDSQQIIVIGSTHLSSLFIRFLRSYSPDQYRVIAVLDDANKFVGRTICGVPVLAPPQNLESVIEEFGIHGIRTDRVIVGGDENLLAEDVLNDIQRTCSRGGVALDFVPKLIGLHSLETSRNSVAQTFTVPKDLTEPKETTVAISTYWSVKRVIDFFAALAGIIVLSPVMLLSSLLVLIDLGSPVLFWQQRVGQNGRSFLLYKFRTLRPPFDGHGRPIPEDRRRSSIGNFLRKTRVDELPQLFNVLVGEMSLIGPRPLLPRDQPTNACQRLLARPGITGWAQVNGGTLITAEEKGALDDWYIRNVSPALDLRIALLTLRFLFTGERRSQMALSQARHVQRPADYPITSPRRTEVLGVNSAYVGRRPVFATKPAEQVKPLQ